MDFFPKPAMPIRMAWKKYHHMDFQLVLALPTEEIARILNTLGARVQAGEHFQNGDMVSGIYEDCDICLDAYRENDRMVLRVIIPDKYNIFPEDDRCTPIYRMQLLETDDLYREGGWNV